MAFLVLLLVFLQKIDDITGFLEKRNFSPKLAENRRKL
jgi:hypothetical protein